MTTSKARAKLGDWLYRAIQGEDIGIVHGATGRIVALRPVEVVSVDHAPRRFTKEEAARAFGPDKEMDAFARHASRRNRPLPPE